MSLGLELRKCARSEISVRAPYARLRASVDIVDTDTDVRLGLGGWSSPQVWFGNGVKASDSYKISNALRSKSSSIEIRVVESVQ
jgi:hypothetical protein